MKGAFLLDTDILVDFLRGYNRAVDFVTVNFERIILSAIVVAELYAGVKGEKEQATLEAFVSIPFL
jgi:predicted nucleic acid-binding protein